MIDSLELFFNLEKESTISNTYLYDTDTLFAKATVFYFQLHFKHFHSFLYL